MPYPRQEMMMTVTDTPETYQGYANRETWAFNLHWANDQTIYLHTLDQARSYLSATYGADWRQLPADELRGAAYGVGEHLRDYWRDIAPLSGLAAVAAMNREVGSWWRVDCIETGEALIQSLDNEA